MSDDPNRSTRKSLTREALSSAGGGSDPQLQKVLSESLAQKTPATTVRLASSSRTDGYEIARDRIRAAAGSGAEKLDLSGLGLRVVPSELSDLKNLRELDLSRNRLPTLSGPVLQLRSLRRLFLGDNALSRLPASFEALERLATLTLNSNNFLTWPSVLERLPRLDVLAPGSLVGFAELANLTGVTHLILGAQGLREVPGTVMSMANLTHLYLWRNQLTQLPRFTRLPKLICLDVSGNPFVSFPESVVELAHLRTLNVGFCPIGGLHPHINKLRALTTLDAHDCNLTDLPDTVADLELETIRLWGNKLGDRAARAFDIATLTHLDLDNTGLRTIPQSVGGLQRLVLLELQRNELRSLPAELASIATLKHLDVTDNLLPILPEILARKQAALILSAYFAERSRRVNEAKLLLVGQGEVGKTSLVKRLVDDRFDPLEDATDGIARRRWDLDVADEVVRVNIWDFGGQEIMHATHQFFLTRRSVYLLVIDSRVDEQENRIEYWLKLIQSFAAESPVLVVSNKCDQHRLELPRRRLEEKYPTISGFFETSCRTGDGIADLRSAIARTLEGIDHVRAQLPVPWLRVKAGLEAMTESFIPLTKFRAFASAEGISGDSQQDELLRLFHDLGTVLSFRDDPRLHDTNVLNPAWVTKGVYDILTWHRLFEEHGVLELRRLGERLDRVQYPEPESHLFLIEMMRKFELCFPFETGAEVERYLVPSLLPKDEPDTGDWSDCLMFEYHYDVLPDSVISRFLVRMHHRISRHTYWRFGAVLTNEPCRAFVRADRSDAKMEILVAGGEAIARRLFLAEIRAHFDSIHAQFKGRPIAEKVVCVVDGQRVVFDRKYLEDNEAAGQAHILAPGTRSLVHVGDVLSGVLTPKERAAAALPPDALARADGVRSSRSPWLSGTFYLLGFVVVFLSGVCAFALLSWPAAIASIGTAMLAITVIGALQLRHDKGLSEKSFLFLMGETWRQVPRLLTGASRTEARGRGEGDAAETHEGSRRGRAVPKRRRQVPTRGDGGDDSEKHHD